MCPKNKFASNGPIMQDPKLEWIVAGPIPILNTNTDRMLMQKYYVNESSRNGKLIVKLVNYYLKLK